MRSIGLLLLGVGLLVWSRGGLGSYRPYVLPVAMLGLVLSVLSFRPDSPAVATTISADAAPPIPDVHGLPVEEALAGLEEAGLVPRLIRSCHPAGTGDTVSSVTVVDRRLWWGVGHEIVGPDGVTAAAADVEPGSRVLVLVPDAGRCGDSRGTSAISPP